MCHLLVSREAWPELGAEDRVYPAPATSGSCGGQLEELCSLKLGGGFSCLQISVVEYLRLWHPIILDLGEWHLGWRGRTCATETFQGPTKPRASTWCCWSSGWNLPPPLSLHPALSNGQRTLATLNFQWADPSPDQYQMRQ